MSLVMSDYNETMSNARDSKFLDIILGFYLETLMGVKFEWGRRDWG